MKEPSPEGMQRDRTQEGHVSRLPEILDGKEAKNLADSARYYKLASGDGIIAGTDKGINYADHNEDRVVVSPDGNFVVVIDGVGGRNYGEKAAEILAESLSKFPQDVSLAADNARNKMKDQNIGGGGAVFVSALLRSEINGKFLDVNQFGDSSLIVIKRNGQISFESVDDSLTQALVDLSVITSDEALYHPSRNKVDFVSPKYLLEVRTYPPISVETGDIVLLMSDGISDNLTAEEIAKKVKEGLTAQDLFSWLSDATGKRMRDRDEIVGKPNVDYTESLEQKAILERRRKDGVYPDGYKSKPKPDNRALAILEIS